MLHSSGADDRRWVGKEVLSTGIPLRLHFASDLVARTLGQAVDFFMSLSPDLDFFHGLHSRVFDSHFGACGSLIDWQGWCLGNKVSPSEFVVYTIKPPFKGLVFVHNPPSMDDQYHGLVLETLTTEYTASWATDQQRLHLHIQL